MKKLRILKDILIWTHTSEILISYLLFIFLAAFVIQLFDPGITSYVDALWYCYAVISTAGFGDLVVTSTVARLVSVFLTVYSILVIALVTGVVVNFYTQVLQIRQKNTVSAFFDQIDRLPDLSREELCELRDRIRTFFNKTN